MTKGMTCMGIMFVVPALACSATSTDHLGISALSPSSGPHGTAVTIRGSDFGATSGGSRVTFNSYSAAIMRWSSNEIVALVPSASGFGAAAVKVERGTRATTPTTFTVTDVSVAAPRPGSPAPIAATPGAFTPAGQCSASRICLTKVGGSSGTLVLAVITQDLDITSGIAFELGFDPTVLRPRGATPGATLTSPVISHAAESVAGGLLTGIAELRRWDGRGTLLSGTRTLWTMTFEVLSKEATDISFMPTSRQVRDADNRPILVTWVGGRLEAVP